MDIFKIVFLGLATTLFIGACVRWRKTPCADGEYIVRKDTCALLGCVVIGQLGDLLRSRWPDRSNVYMFISLALLPIGIFALYLLVRLTLAFRRSKV